MFQRPSQRNRGLNKRASARPEHVSANHQDGRVADAYSVHPAVS